jgi:hypothetical protein
MKTHSWRLLGTGLALVAMFAATLIYTSDNANAAVFSHKFDGYFTRTYTVPEGPSMTYYLYVPRDYDPDKSYPLVLLLHGGGERANAKDSLAQNRSLLLSDEYANYWSSSAVQSRWPSFIVVPQVAGQNQWVNTPAAQGSYQLAAQPTTSLRLAKAIVDVASTSPDFRWAAMAPGTPSNAGPPISRRLRPSQARATPRKQRCLPTCPSGCFTVQTIRQCQCLAHAIWCKPSAPLAGNRAIPNTRELGTASGCKPIAR